MNLGVKVSVPGQQTKHKKPNPQQRTSGVAAQVALQAQSHHIVERKAERKDSDQISLAFNSPFIVTPLGPTGFLHKAPSLFLLENKPAPAKQ